MEFSHLKAFYQVAVSGNFSKAATELFISQPALSRQIAALEKELDCQLFTRQSRKSVLTNSGKRLLIHAEQIVSLNDKAKKEMMELNNLNIGDLTIGASTTIANYFLPSLLAIYKDKYPGINIHLHVNSSRQIEKMVQKGKVDIGLVAGKIDVLGLYQELFAEDELFLVVPKDHRFTTNNHLISKELNQETFLYREEGADTQRLFDSLLETFDILPQRKFVLGSTEAIKRGVIHNMGIAFLSKYTFQYELELGILVPIESISMKRPFSITYQKDTRLSPSASTFCDLLKNNVIL